MAGAGKQGSQGRRCLSHIAVAAERSFAGFPPVFCPRPAIAETMDAPVPPPGNSGARAMPSGCAPVQTAASRSRPSRRCGPGGARLPELEHAGHPQAVGLKPDPRDADWGKSGGSPTHGVRIVGRPSGRQHRAVHQAPRHDACESPIACGNPPVHHHTASGRHHALRSAVISPVPSPPGSRHLAPPESQRETAPCPAAPRSPIPAVHGALPATMPPDRPPETPVDQGSEKAVALDSSSLGIKSIENFDWSAKRIAIFAAPQHSTHIQNGAPHQHNDHFERFGFTIELCETILRRN